MDLKIWYSQIWIGSLLLSSIPIIYKWLEDKDNKDKDLKTKIYHLALKIMLQYKCLLLTYNWLNVNNILDIAL